ncbi:MULTISPECIES: hypothetical protein [Legionella]|uniref:Uncharacterized protein n=1 Tax=Legionella steelei TaxID=947033 RepID=A0A0W0ZMT7_9GAMM|nr:MULTISPECIES: hypothetical protein [Legionella]KTD70099.1 hypothetical protein Lste_0703 [Legionella steelei]MBN9226222.1 hypothetical protein [Legionella steelei]OJW12442.1 MAG: hypothetical protein BGO44_10305 [Legionella sp. 39-23]
MPKPKKKLLQETSLQNGEVQGYKFQDDDYANQMAYLFNGKKGEEAAKKILDEANAQFPNPLDLLKKKKYIEEQLKQRAIEVDNGFHAGIKDIFASLKNVDHPVKGEEAGKDAMLSLMKGLGLNVDDDNVQTHYSPGPPMVFQVTWVNRPGENLKNEDSNVNKLAQSYSDCLSPRTGEKQQFDTSWQTHKSHALQGGPKIEKSEFLSQADQSFQAHLDSLKNPVQHVESGEEQISDSRPTY